MKASWSERFKAYITKRFGEGCQQKAAFSLKVSPSVVSYWCRGSIPRADMLRRIAKWSEGRVPADEGDDSRGGGRDGKRRAPAKALSIASPRTGTDG